jgi:hypothetical protein
MPDDPKAGRGKAYLLTGEPRVGKTTAIKCIVSNGKSWTSCLGSQRKSHSHGRAAREQSHLSRDCFFGGVYRQVVA